MKRVALTAEFPPIALEILDAFEVMVHQGTGRRSEDELAGILREVHGAMTLVTDRITREILRQCSSLEVIGNYGVGTDNIDLQAAKDHGVIVTNTPDVLTAATADLTLGLILAVTRRFPEGERLIRTGAFLGWQPLLLLGRSLEALRLGIVGMGRIGHAVAQRATAFGMEIVFHSRVPMLEVERELGAAWLPLPELLRTSDVVSLHTPLTPETRSLMGRENFSLMKQGSYLINTSRGEVVDEEALVEALESGRLAGAGLDVYEYEPAVSQALVTRADVVLLPHLGSATVEARREMARLAARCVADVLQGSRPKHRIV